jgi:thymidine phosphorylase
VSTKEIGMISFNLGAGKLSKSEAIDMQAGIYLNKTINEYVKKGETIATLYSSKLINDEYCKRFLNNIIFNKSKHKQEKMILFTLSNI